MLALCEIIMYLIFHSLFLFIHNIEHPSYHLLNFIFSDKRVIYIQSKVMPKVMYNNNKDSVSVMIVVIIKSIRIKNIKQHKQQNKVNCVQITDVHPFVNYLRIKKCVAV